MAFIKVSVVSMLLLFAMLNVVVAHVMPCPTSIVVIPAPSAHTAKLNTMMMTSKSKIYCLC